MALRNSDRIRDYLRAKPMVVGVGVEKCGTTSLHDLLRLSPDISAAAPKELEFFDGKNRQRGLDWYLGCHDHERPVLMDVTPSYHWREQTLRRIQETLGRLAVAVMLRNPVERIASAFCHRNYWFFEPQFRRTGRLGEFDHSPASLFALPRDRFVFPSFVGVVQRVRAVFGPERVVVADIAQLVADPGALAGRLAAAIGQDIRLPEGAAAPSSNTLFMPSFHLGEEILAREPAAGGLIDRPKDVYICRNGFPAWIAEGGGYAALKAMERRWREPLDEATARRVWERYYAPEAEELTRRHGIDVAGWARFRLRGERMMAPLAPEAAEASVDVARWRLRRLVAEGDEAGARALIGRLLTLRSDHVPLLRLAAWVHLESGDLATARAVIDRALQLAPMLPEVHQLARTIGQSAALFGAAPAPAGAG